MTHINRLDYFFFLSNPTPLPMLHHPLPPTPKKLFLFFLNVCGGSFFPYHCPQCHLLVKGSNDEAASVL